MPNGTVSKTSGGAKSYTIIFISDLHGMLDGYGLPPDRSAGLAKIASLVTAARRGDGLSDRQVIVCLGGDMVKAGVHRLLHTDTVVTVWNHICEQIQPDVVVLGNHEFDTEFYPLWPVLASLDKGATRNTYWLESRPGNECARLPTEPLPPSSLHRIVPAGADDEGILVVGLVDQKHDSNYDPLMVRDREQQLGNVLKPHCLSCPNANGRAVVHVAHYSENRADGIDQQGRISREGFGARWAHDEESPQRRPHAVLKAHCHSLTDASFTGTISRADRLERRQNVDGYDVPWVPTFAVGQMGELIGVLNLDLHDQDIHYEWRPWFPGKAHKSGNFPTGLPPLVRPGRDTLLFQQELPRLGHFDRNPHVVCQTMCLLLRAMLMRYREPSHHLALAPVACVRTGALVPEVISDEVMTDYLQAYRRAAGPVPEDTDPKSLWHRKLDSYDLHIVFGSGPVRTYEVADLERLPKAIQYSLQPSSIRPVSLPKYAHRLGEVPCYWARMGDQTWVLVPHQDGNGRVYEASEREGQLALMDLEETADNWLRRLSPRFVTTTGRAFSTYFEKTKTLRKVSKTTLAELYNPAMANTGRRSIVKECLEYLRPFQSLAGSPGKFWRPGV